MRYLVLIAFVATLAVACATWAPARHHPTQVHQGPDVAILAGPIFGGESGNLVPLANWLDARPDGREVDLLISSGGGEIETMLTLLRAFDRAKARDIRIRCFAIGQVMSAAFWIYAECDERFAISASAFLFHPIRRAMEGIIVLKATMVLEMYEDLHTMDEAYLDAIDKDTSADREYLRKQMEAEAVWTPLELDKGLPRFLEDVRPMYPGLLSALSDGKVVRAGYTQPGYLAAPQPPQGVAQ